MSKRKNPLSESNLNNDICELLMELAQYEKNVSRNVHKFNSYRKAANVIASYEKRIQSGIEARKLNGVGEKISKKIDEFLQSGKLRKLESIHNDEHSQSINLLTRVSGIGPVKAAELVKKGIKTIEHLKENRDLLNHHQLIGIKYFKDFEKRIPRCEIQQIEHKLKEKIIKYDALFNITICGSYRRGKPESGDIDMLITHPSLTVDSDKKKQREMLQKITTLDDIIIDTISIGDTKFMGVCRFSEDYPARRLDIRLVPHEQFYCAVLYFTGSDVFNKTMRAHALEQGFTLNEYSLRHIGVTGVPGKPIPVSSEEEIFDYIDYLYKPPSERNM